MNIFLHVGSSSFIIFPIVPIGDKLWEIFGTKSGKFFSIYSTNAGQHDVVKNPFSSSSFPESLGHMDDDWDILGS